MGKGASSLDKCAHRVFGFAIDERDNGWWKMGADCARCGHPLESSYCEERLYMVRCRECGVVSLIEGGSPMKAALRIGTAPELVREATP